MRVFEWLAEFRRDDGRTMVWDDLWTIYDEYRNKLTDQDFGLLVVRDKMASARFVGIEFEADGSALVPAAFSGFDRSDRKFLATLLADVGRSTLVNATDTDWLAIEEPLEMAGVQVEHLLEDWLRTKQKYKGGGP
jgi:hypothetical protein